MHALNYGSAKRARVCQCLHFIAMQPCSIMQAQFIARSLVGYLWAPRRFHKIKGRRVTWRSGGYEPLHKCVSGEAAWRPLYIQFVSMREVDGPLIAYKVRPAGFCCIIASPNGFPQPRLLSEDIRWLSAKQPAFNQGRLSPKNKSFGICIFTLLLVSTVWSSAINKKGYLLHEPLR